MIRSKSNLITLISAVSRIVFRKHIAPPALEGLDEYSHVWIFFIFSRNTNSKVVTRWVEQNGSFTFPPRVKAPLLLGRSTVRSHVNVFTYDPDYID
mmetsp:Transcript_15710/g.19479  ORF Transcript_15710/g.19479 Transcript_15710/m.19479 type:complete len:96 (-) Transcript_15710:972-1259(-)